MHVAQPSCPFPCPQVRRPIVLASPVLCEMETGVAAMQLPGAALSCIRMYTVQQHCSPALNVLGNPWLFRDSSPQS